MTEIDIFNEINAFQNTLNNIGTALKKSFANKGVWGVAGIREESLVFFLAETMREFEWDIKYEYPYSKENLSYECPDETKFWRCDIMAEKEIQQLWIEAKWWWKGNKISPILQADLHKFELINNKDNAYPIAVIFTIDDIKTKSNSLKWTLDGAKTWMEKIIIIEKLDLYWKHLGTLSIESPYRGKAMNDNNTKDREGIFTASFYLYTGGLC